MELQSMINNARKARSKTAKPAKAGRAAKSGKVNDDFDVDLADTSAETSAEGKKAQRSKRRAAKASEDKATPAKKSAKAAKKDKAAKADKKATKADKPTKLTKKEARAAARAAKASGKSAKAGKAGGATAYSGDLPSLLTSKLAKPGRLNPADVTSVHNHFIHGLNKTVQQSFSVSNIAKSFVGASADAFGAKMKPADFADIASKVQASSAAQLAKAAKPILAELKATVKNDPAAVTPEMIDDHIDSLTANDE